MEFGFGRFGHKAMGLSFSEMGQSTGGEISINGLYRNTASLPRLLGLRYQHAPIIYQIEGVLCHEAQAKAVATFTETT